MTQSIDNSEWVMQGVIRDPVTGALLRVNADGSINVSGGGAGGAGTGFTSASTAGTALVGTLSTNGLSLGVPAWLTTAGAGGGAGTGFTSTTTAGTAIVGTLSTNGLSIGVPSIITNALTTARASTDGVGLATAQTNVTWTVNSAGVSLNAAGYAGTATTMAAGLSATLNSVGLNLSVGAYLTTADLSQNSSKYAGTGTSATNASITLNTNGLAISVGAPGGGVTLSSFANFPGLINTSGQTVSVTSMAVAFLLPQAVSFSFMRMPVLMTVLTASIGSSAANTSGQGGASSTLNAVFYSLGTGASSQSLISVLSGSYGASWSAGVSFSSAASNWSITQGQTYGALGVSQSVSTQYSQTAASGTLSTGFITNLSSLRWLDILFNGSLSAGPYWLLVGISTTSSGAGAFSNSIGPNPVVSYRSHYMVSQINSYFNAMGDTAGSSNGYLEAGSFSTGGGGTTSIFPIGNISSQANNPKLYFQLLRSA